MDERNLFLEQLLSCVTPDKKFYLLLNACNEQRAFTGQPDNKVRGIVSTINWRINKSAYRSTGIKLLKIFLTQCQDEVFVEHCVHWMTQCLHGAANPVIEDEAYDVLRMLINMSHDFQELTKPITGTVIAKLLDQLLNTENSIAALQCLQATLHYYPGSCKMKLNSIQSYLLTFLDVEEKLLVEHAGRCMCYLPLLQTSEQKKVSPWMDVLSELCATANTVLYALFENVHEVVMPGKLTQLSAGYNLPSKNAGIVRTYHLAATRIVNILTFVEGMLLGELHQVKAVRADILIALAYRILAVNCKMGSQGHSMDHVFFTTVLPGVHVAAFNMLQTLVSCCPGGLIKYGPIFCKLVLQTLKWTSKSTGYGVERPYRYLREAAYTFLQNWILRASAASCVELVAEELVSLMLSDVFIKKETVTLQFQEKGTKTSSKLSQRGQWKLADPKANAGPCEAALGTLCALVQTSGSLLKPAVHMRLQEIAVSILLDIRRASGPEDHLFPFCVIGCRVQLFRLLLVLTLHPHPQWPPPTQFALSLFAWGQHDSALEVAGFCNLAVACTRQMVHPSQSSHQFPLSVDEMRSSAGLPELAPVRDLQKNFEKNKDVDDVEIETDTCSTSPNNVKSLNNRTKSLDFNDFGKVVSPSPNSGKRKKSCISSCEIVMNGVELSPHSSNVSKPKKKKLDSSDFEGLHSETRKKLVKPEKKKSHLLFTVEELNVTNKKTSRKSGEGWQVTDISKNIKKMSKKEKALSTFVEVSEIPIKRKRSNVSDNLERNKTRKLNKTPKSDVDESPKSWVVQELCQQSKKMSSKIGGKYFLESNEKTPSKSSEKSFVSEKSFIRSSENLSNESTEKSLSKSNEKLPSESSEKSHSNSSDESSDSEKSFPKSNEKSPSKSSDKSCDSEKSFPKSSDKSPSKSSDKSCSSEKSFSKSNERSPSKSIEKSFDSDKSFQISNEKSPKPSENLSNKSTEKSLSKSNEKLSSELSDNYPVDTSKKSFLESLSISCEKSPLKSGNTSSDNEKLFPKSNEKSPSKSSENISSEANDKSPSKSSEKILSKSSEGASFSNLNKTVSLLVSEEIDIEKIDNVTNKETRDNIDIVGRKQNNSTNFISVIELDVDDENPTLEQGEKNETKISGRGKNINEKDESKTHQEKKKGQVEVIMEADNKSVSQKEPLITMSESNRYNLRKDRLNSPAKVGNNDAGAQTNNPGKDKFGAKSSKEEKCVPKSTSPIIELTISSDSECGEQQKKGPEEFRRITRSIAKLSSTPRKGTEQCIDIEEIPSSQDGINNLNESTILEEESATAGEPSVVLADSDDSANMVLRMESDRESVEINDITNEFKEKNKEAEKGKGEISISKDNVLKKPDGTKNMNNSVTSDREMEEVNTGMEAVENSPDVDVEDVASCEKETAGKKLSSNGEEEGSDSGSAEEDILKTFVDVVSPKSE